MVNGEITEDDDISYDGVNWNGGDAPSSAAPQSSDNSSGLSLGLDQAEDSMDSLLFEEGTSINKENSVAEEINLEEDVSKVDHVYIPEEFNDTMTGVLKVKPKKERRRGGSSALFYIATSIATLAILAIVAGGAYYFYTKRNNSADILDNISEQIAVNTGTLADVRDALDKDTPEDYINSIGILKQYIKPDDSAPSAVGLDGQVKMNLLISYNRRIESSSSINDKITAAMKKAPGNIDLVKAKALYLYEQKHYDEAAELLQPFTDKNDQEVFYELVNEGRLIKAPEDHISSEPFNEHRAYDRKESETKQFTQKLRRLLFDLVTVPYDDKKYNAGNDRKLKHELSPFSDHRSAIHSSDDASLGMRQSPLGDNETDPTLGPSGRQLRLNCWLKNLLKKFLAAFLTFSSVSSGYALMA